MSCCDHRQGFAKRLSTGVCNMARFIRRGSKRVRITCQFYIEFSRVSRSRKCRKCCQFFFRDCRLSGGTRDVVGTFQFATSRKFDIFVRNLHIIVRLKDLVQATVIREHSFGGSNRSCPRQTSEHEKIGLKSLATKRFSQRCTFSARVHQACLRPPNFMGNKLRFHWLVVYCY